MSKTKKLMVSAVFSFYLLINILQIFGGFNGVNSAGAKEASLFPWGPYLRAKQYDEHGNFLGCMGPGTDCIVFPLNQNSFTISTAGFGIQPTDWLNAR